MGKEIQATSEKLERLAKRAPFSPTQLQLASIAARLNRWPLVARAVAQRRSLFDDPAEEINEMTAKSKKELWRLWAGG